MTAFTHVQPGTAAASLSGDLLAAYTEGLREYLARRDEQGLLRAYEIGRRAFSLGNGVLDMAAAHSRALAAVLAATPQADAAAAAEAFLCEALSPFEVTYRTFRDANATLRRLNDMLEEQARRLAYTLHDEVTQTLASAHLRLADAAAALPPGARAALRDVREVLDRVEEQVRELSRDLRPTILDDLGLVPAIRFLADSASKRWGIAVHVAAFLDRRLPPSVETVLYRIAQETLCNAGRHAQATQAQVWLHERNGRVHYTIRDDGIGFDAAAVTGAGRRGLGLAGIEERVALLDGTVRIADRGGRGTEIAVEIPLENMDDAGECAAGR
ncbi:MAG TPA: sensor histidine kinase [Vicinamibacterales bacterium]